MDAREIEELVNEVYKENKNKDLIEMLKEKDFRFMRENLSETYLSILIVNKYKSPKYQKLILVNNNLLKNNTENNKKKLERFLIAREYGYYLTRGNDDFNHFCKKNNKSENILLDTLGEALLMPSYKVKETISQNKNLSEYELTLLFENIFGLPYGNSTKRYFDIVNNNLLEKPKDLIKK